MKKEECIEIFERYINRLATADEIKRLSNWIRNNQEISQWLEQQILASPSTIDSEVQMRMLKNIDAGISSETKEITINKGSDFWFQLNKWMRVAALFLLPVLTAAGTYLFMTKDVTSSAPLIIAVERGQKANVTLPDGSKAWLNSQSKLTYSADFNVKKRELQLEGEAYFEVAHNPQKPFIVRSKDMAVEALGTAFSVKAYAEDSLISSILMRGKVRITTPSGELTLLPNEKVMYDKTSHTMKQSKVTNAVNFTGWIHNELRFENESLADIAKSIQRMYNVDVTFASENIKNQRYTGTVNNKSMESVLNFIKLTSPVSFKIDNQQVTLFEK
jgi:ferric-dicitrate binding protein FerR (iron transport regulator)